MDNFTGRCFTCGDTGHLKRDCPQRNPHLSAAIPAVTSLIDRRASYAEHLARIDELVELWISGAITMQQKRQAIADENFAYYGGPKIRHGINLTRA